MDYHHTGLLKLKPSNVNSLASVRSPYRAYCERINTDRTSARHDNVVGCGSPILTKLGSGWLPMRPTTHSDLITADKIIKLELVRYAAPCPIIK